MIDLELLRIATTSGLEVERELIKHSGASVIIPVEPGGRLVLIRQLRVATGTWIWEFPAGTLEEGETPRECARRELIEETGWKAGRLRKLFDFFPTPGVSTEKMHIFLADRLEKAGSSKRDADEELIVWSFSIPQLEEMIRKGEIIDGKTILSFLYFLRFVEEANA